MLEATQAEHDRLETWILLSVFFVMLPGVGLATGGTIPLALHGYVLAAITCGIAGGVILALGIALTSYFANRQKRLKAKVKDIRSQMGQDVRSIREKVIDGVLGWTFGKT